MGAIPIMYNTVPDLITRGRMAGNPSSIARPVMRDHETIKINCLFANTVYPICHGFH